MGLPEIARPPLHKDPGVRILAALLVVFVLADALALWHYSRIRTERPKKIHLLVYGDGVFYYSMARSMVFDRDLDCTNEARYYWHEEGAVEAWRGPSGRLNNYCPIGSSLLYIPIILLAHLVAWGDGLSFIYPATAALGACLLAWTAIVMIYRTFGDLAAAVGLWLATNVAYYMSIEPLTSHACSLFAVTAFVLCRRGVLAQGALLALAVLVRPEHLLLGLLADGRKKIPVLAIGLAALVPQVLVWRHLSGDWISPVAGNSSLVPLHALQLLFSTRHGLFLWHPLFLVGFVGLIISRKWSYLAAVVAAILFYGSRHAWWGFHSFGSRYFVGLAIFFVPGLVAVLQYMRSRRVWLPWALVGVLALWNASIMLLYISRSIPQADAVPISRLLLAPFYAAKLLVQT